MIKTLKDTYRNGEAMRTHNSTILCGVSVFISGKYLAQKFSFSSSEGGQVKGKTQRTAESFKGAAHGVIHRGFPNERHIQIVEVVFHEYTLSNSLGYGGDVLSKNVQ